MSWIGSKILKSQKCAKTIKKLQNLIFELQKNEINNPIFPTKVSQAQYQSHAGIELNGSIKSFFYSYFLNETVKNFTFQKRESAIDTFLLC